MLYHVIWRLFDGDDFGFGFDMRRQMKKVGVRFVITPKLIVTQKWRQMRRRRKVGEAHHLLGSVGHSAAVQSTATSLYVEVG